ANGSLPARGACRLEPELEQDILGELQAKLPAAAYVGNRLDLSPRALARVAKTRLCESLAEEEALGLSEPRGGRAYPRTGDGRRLDHAVPLRDPDARPECGRVDFFALGYLVEPHQLVGPWNRNLDPSDQLGRGERRLFWPPIEAFDHHPAQSGRA